MSFDPTRRRLRKRDLAKRNSCSTRTVDNHITRGLLPPPQRDELGRPFWWSDVIEAHEAKLEREAAA